MTLCPRLEIGNSSDTPCSRPSIDRLEYVISVSAASARRLRPSLPPVWNQAKTSSASPTKNAAIPCLMWWWRDPASWPGKNDGSEPAGSAQ